MFYTYAHYKKSSNEIFYIGKGKRDRASSKANRNRYWKFVAEKYGFEAKILAYWETEKEAFDHEILLISCFKDMGCKLTNLSDGGEGASGVVRTQEYKDKMSKSLTGKKRPVEVVEKIRKAITGRTLTEEHKAKISAGGKGRIVSEETKVKMSAWQKGKTLTEQHKANMRKPKSR